MTDQPAPPSAATLQSALDRLIDTGLADLLKTSDAATPLVEWLHTETGVSRVWLRLAVRGLSLLGRRGVKKGTDWLQPVARRKVVALLMRIPGVTGVLTALETRLTTIQGAADADTQLRELLAARDDTPSAAQHLATAQWAQYATLESTDRVHEAVLGLQDAVAALTNPQPVLRTRNVRDTERNRFLFAARRAALVDREDELAILDTFFFSEAAFAWRVLAGPAGVGKSRLALEACAAAGGVFRAGFLDVAGAFAWESWRPNQPTILVIDYADAVARPLHRIAAQLADNSALEFPVRMLLIARQPAGRWLDDFVGTGSEAGAIRDALDAPALSLTGLSDDALWSVVMRFCGDLPHPPQRDRTLQALSRIDPLRRPLFAAFAGDAIANARNLRHWDAEALLNDVLRRDEERTWDPAGVQPRDKALLALVTMAGGVTAATLAYLDAAWFPTGDDFDPPRHEAMTGRPATEWLAPLEPDILGELFVLNFLQPRSVVDRQRLLAVRDAAWRTNSIATGAFLLRAVADHPRHATLRSLLDTAPNADIAGLGPWVMLLSLIADRYASVGDAVTARALLQRVIAFGVRHPDNARIRFAEAVGRTPFVAPQRGRAADAAAASEMDAIRRIGDAFPQDPTFRMVEARALQIRVAAFFGANRFQDALAGVDRLRELHENDRDVPPIREIYAIALAGFVMRLCQVLDEWRMSSVEITPPYTTLGALAATYPDDTGVQVHWRNAREAVEHRCTYDTMQHTTEWLMSHSTAEEGRERRQRLVEWAQHHGYPAPQLGPAPDV